MNINRVRITIEPAKYPKVAEPTYSLLRIEIQRWPGESINYEKVIRDDDMRSMWDHIWTEAGEQLKRELLQYI